MDRDFDLVAEKGELAFEDGADRKIAYLLRNRHGASRVRMLGEPKSRIRVTIKGSPFEPIASDLLAEIESLAGTRLRYEEVGPAKSDDSDVRVSAECSVCRGPGPLTKCELEPSVQPRRSWAIRSSWNICPECLSAIREGNRKRLEARWNTAATGPHHRAVVRALMRGIKG